MKGRFDRLLPMLNFIASSIWTRLFGHSAELLKGVEALEFFGGFRDRRGLVTPRKCVFKVLFLTYP